MLRLIRMSSDYYLSCVVRWGSAPSKYILGHRLDERVGVCQCCCRRRRRLQRMSRMPASQSPRSSSPRLGPGPRESSPRRESSPARGPVPSRVSNRPPLSTNVVSKPQAAAIRAHATPLPQGQHEAAPFVSAERLGRTLDAAHASPPTAATPSVGAPHGASPHLRSATVGQPSPSGPPTPMERRGSTSATSAVSRYAVASSPTALPAGMSEPADLKQALSMLRLLTSQLHEARGDKSAIWEQTRADARAMAQVARNIEGNQGVVSSAIQSLEQQLEATRQEKERERETARGDKKLFERLQREQERMLREAERQRDKALATAAEAGVARQKAQEHLEMARRTESDALRTAHAERAALAREVRQLQDRLQLEAGGEAPPPAQLAELAAGVSSLRAMLGGADTEGGTGTHGERLLAAARSQRDEAEERLETLRAGMQAQILALTREHEATLAALEAHRAQRSPELQASEVRRAAAERGATELRAQLQACRGELSEARAATERLQVQAQLEHGGATSRARESAQQLAHKEAQTHALERELSASAGQLVVAQAEVRQLSGAAEQQQERLRAAEAQRQALTDQLAQSAGDREFCFDIIGELKAQLAAARAGARPRSPPPGPGGGAAQEVRL